MAPTPIRYDFTAAAALEEALDALVKRLKDFESTRTTQRSNNLGDPSGSAIAGTWLGGRRREYEADYNTQMRTLKALITQALALRGKIVTATEDAALARRQWERTGGNR